MFAHKETVAKYAVLAATLGFAAYISFSQHIGFDTFWHLKLGQDLIHSGDSPFVDQYSFTYSGAAVTTPPVFFEVLLALFVDVCGMPLGLHLAKVFFFCSALLLLFLFMHHLKSPALLYALVLPWAVLFFFERNLLRPELVSYLLAALSMFLFARARHQFKARYLTPTVLLLLLWSNYHLSVIFGYLIIGSLFLQVALDAALRRDWDKRFWLRWALWGLLAFVVGFFRPQWAHPVVHLLGFEQSWSSLVSGYNAADPYFGMLFARMYGVLVVALLLTTLWRKQWALALLVVVLNLKALQMMRLVLPASYVTFFVLILVVSELEPADLLGRVKRNTRLALVAILLATTALLGWQLWQRLNRITVTQELASSLYPVDMVEYLKRANYRGKVFNEFRIGGFLLANLDKQLSVYIDGRTEIMYSAEHAQRYAWARSDSAVLAQEVDRYGIDYMLLLDLENRLFAVDGLDDFGLDYNANGYFWYVQKPVQATDADLSRPNFPLLGKLLVWPHCFQHHWLKKLEPELALAPKILPRDSDLLPVVNLLQAYRATDDRVGFLRGQSQLTGRSPYTVRLAAQMARDIGRLDLATLYYAQLGDIGFRDYIPIARLSLQMGLHDKALQIITLALEDKQVQLYRLRELATVVREFSQSAPQHPGLPELRQQMQQVVGSIVPFTEREVQQRCQW